MTLHNDGPPALDGVDHIRAARAWLEANPADSAAEAALRDWLRARDAAEIERPQAYTWEGQGEDDHPRHWIVPDWLPARRLALLSGPPGSGKTYLALQLAAGIASGGGEGDAWIEAPQKIMRLGSAIPAEGARVVYCTWEEEWWELFTRLSRISGPEAPWVAPQRLGKLQFLDMSRQGPLWAPTGYDREGITGTGEWLQSYCEEDPPALLVIDTLAKGYAGNENARHLVSAFLGAWDWWGESLGCAILMLGHPPKSGASYSGTTGWLGGVRTFWSLEKKPLGKLPKRGEEDTRPYEWRLENEKGNYRADGAEALHLAWDLHGGVRLKVAGPWPDKQSDSTSLNGSTSNGKAPAY